MPEHLPRLVEQLLPAVAEPVREHRIDLRVELPGDLPQVRVDPMQLEQVLLEVLSNAVDAMPEARRGELLLSLAARYRAHRRSKFDDLVPDVLRHGEIARMLAGCTG